MPNQITYYTHAEDIHYVCTNDIDVYHYGLLPANEKLVTGQPHVYTFSDEVAMLAFVPIEFRISHEG